MHVYNSLRKARLNSHLTLRDAALQLDMSSPMLRRYEYSPIYTVPSSVIKKLADFYRMSPSQLLDYKEDCCYVSDDLSLGLINPVPLLRSYKHFLPYYEYYSSLDISRLMKQYEALDIRGKHMVALAIRTEYQRIVNGDY